jgi:toxin ParE1/3/4
VSHTVRFAPEALIHLDELEAYIREAASPEIAARYVDTLVGFCESLGMFPQRGTRRDHIRPGLRTLGYQNATIAFVFSDDVVSILGVFYKGRDYEAGLS